MEQPNVGLGRPQFDQQNSNSKKRVLANESKRMDEVLGSNVSKDYGRVGSQIREGRNLPLIMPNDPALRAGNIQNIPNNPNSAPLEMQRNGRPISQENFEKPSSREMMEMFKPQMMNALNQSEKVDGIERTMKYLIDQINGFEKLLYNESRRTKSYFDTDKERIDRLETALKVYEDTMSLGSSDTANRINLLESKLMREEKTKIELREKLAFQEQNQREMLEYVKSLQNQENQELIQMRSILQEKFTEDQGFAIKEKERSKTLFHEVVRLGEQQERSAEQLQGLNLALEARLQAMESKYQVNERALSTLHQKGESGLSNLTEWNDQIERKFQGLETNVYTLTREQARDKEIIAKLEAINTKMSSDLSVLLKNLDSDYQQKLDMRVTELVNRIVMEHEERIKNHDEIRNQVEIRDQINGERTQYEREEMRERYNTMDALVRAEFERKDEAIRTLHNIVETQVRALQAGIKQEELARNQFEVYQREEVGRFQEDVKKEFDVFRQQQTITTEKLTEMIKIEIDTRLSSDIELKNQINTITQNISQDIEILKENLENQVEAISKELRSVASDSAERANQLSRYIDQEITNVNQSFNSKYEKLKVLFAKFGEQFKNHLLNTEAFRKETLGKVQEIEQTIEYNKEETRMQIIELEKRLEGKFKEQKELMTTTISNNNKVLDDKMSKIREQEEGDISVLKEAIENSRTIFNNKIEKLMELNETYHKNVSKSLTKILEDINNVKSNVSLLKNELQNITGAFSDDIIDLKGYIETQLMTERVIRGQLIEESYDGLKKNMNDINSSLNLLRVADDKLSKDLEGMEKRYDERFHSYSEQLSDAFLKLSGLNDNLAEFEEKAEEDQAKLISRMTADFTISENNDKILFGELKKVVEVITADNKKIKSFQGKVTNFLISLSRDSGEIRRKVEKDVLALVDNKIQTVLERIKKEDQLLWEKTLLHVNNNFKEAAPFVNTKIAPKTQLHELVTQEDTYQTPVVKGNLNAGGNKVNVQPTQP